MSFGAIENHPRYLLTKICDVFCSQKGEERFNLPPERSRTSRSCNKKNTIQILNNFPMKTKKTECEGKVNTQGSIC
jgi:hypothetical protein